ncbi:unnamed protein product [Amoebophrya sp. A120]|nr:unnamed protein product [Amoebophrya sp. A120]|eukprot:GSA120T00008632001.1
MPVEARASRPSQEKSAEGSSASATSEPVSSSSFPSKETNLDLPDELELPKIIVKAEDYPHPYGGPSDVVDSLTRAVMTRFVTPGVGEQIRSLAREIHDQNPELYVLGSFLEAQKRLYVKADTAWLHRVLTEKCAEFLKLRFVDVPSMSVDDSGSFQGEPARASRRTQLGYLEQIVSKWRSTKIRTQQNNLAVLTALPKMENWPSDIALVPRHLVVTDGRTNKNINQVLSEQRQHATGTTGKYEDGKTFLFFIQLLLPDVLETWRENEIRRDRPEASSILEPRPGREPRPPGAKELTLSAPEDATKLLKLLQSTSKLQIWAFVLQGHVGYNFEVLTEPAPPAPSGAVVHQQADADHQQGTTSSSSSRSPLQALGRDIVKISEILAFPLFTTSTRPERKAENLAPHDTSETTAGAPAPPAAGSPSFRTMADDLKELKDLQPLFEAATTGVVAQCRLPSQGLDMLELVRYVNLVVEVYREKVLSKLEYDPNNHQQKVIRWGTVKIERRPEFKAFGDQDFQKVYGNSIAGEKGKSGKGTGQARPGPGPGAPPPPPGGGNGNSKKADRERQKAEVDFFHDSFRKDAVWRFFEVHLQHHLMRLMRNPREGDWVILKKKKCFKEGQQGLGNAGTTTPTQRRLLGTYCAPAGTAVQIRRVYRSPARWMVGVGGTTSRTKKGGEKSSHKPAAAVPDGTEHESKPGSQMDGGGPPLSMASTSVASLVTDFANLHLNPFKSPILSSPPERRGSCTAESRVGSEGDEQHDDRTADINMADDDEHVENEQADEKRQAGTSTTTDLAAIFEVPPAPTAEYPYTIAISRENLRGPLPLFQEVREMFASELQQDGPSSSSSKGVKDHDGGRGAATFDFSAFRKREEARHYIWQLLRPLLFERKVRKMKSRALLQQKEMRKVWELLLLYEKRYNSNSNVRGRAKVKMSGGTRRVEEGTFSGVADDEGEKEHNFHHISVTAKDLFLPRGVGQMLTHFCTKTIVQRAAVEAARTLYQAYKSKKPADELMRRELPDHPEPEVGLAEE